MTSDKAAHSYRVEDTVAGDVPSDGHRSRSAAAITRATVARIGRTSER